MLILHSVLRPPLFLLDHVWHRNFRVLLEHAGHQAVTSDVIDALKRVEITELMVRNLFAWPQRCTSDPSASNSRTHLADVAGPRRLLLARRSQEDHREGLTVGRLHHNFKLQVIEALACCIVWEGEQTCEELGNSKAWREKKVTAVWCVSVWRYSQSSSLASSSSMRVHSIRESAPPCCWKTDVTQSVVLIILKRKMYQSGHL